MMAKNRWLSGKRSVDGAIAVSVEIHEFNHFQYRLFQQSFILHPTDSRASETENRSKITP